MGAASIQIESVILHLLNPQKDAPVCSQRPLQITDPRIFEYFTKHIASSQSAPKIREARFQSLDGPSAAACRGILEGKTDLVAGSQALARSLFGILKADQKRISRGDLAVCLYQNEDAERRLALLKIDPVEGFRHAVKKERGETYVEVEIDPDLMPSTSQELQKCAFVRLRDAKSPEPDMMLLDLQGREEKVAQFFTRTFLGAELMEDPRVTTRQAAKAAIDIENELLSLGEWGEPVRHEVRAVFAGPAARLTKPWVGKLPVSKEAQEKVEARLAKEQVLDKTLPIDGNLLAKLNEKAKYQGSYGLKIEVLEKNHDDVIHSIELKRRKAGADYFEIVIRTPTLTRVS
jgi:hypothetical protein